MTKEETVQLCLFSLNSKNNSIMCHCVKEASSDVYRCFIEEEAEREAEEAAESNSKNSLVSSVDINMLVCIVLFCGRNKF